MLGPSSRRVGRGRYITIATGADVNTHPPFAVEHNVRQDGAGQKKLQPNGELKLER